MPRPRSIIPKRRQEIQLPEDLLARVLADLYSDAERCVPYGKFSQFVEECIREHYRKLEDEQVKATVDMIYEPSRTQGNCPPAESGGQTVAEEEHPATVYMIECRYPMSYGKLCDAYPNCECGKLK